VVYSKLQRAIEFSVQKHLGQERDGEFPLPYITHPFEVLIALRTLGSETDEDMLCAAILHDVVEESAVTFDELFERFGPRTTTLVDELTRRLPSEAELAGLDREAQWQVRSNKLLAEIRAMSPSAQKIKLADRLANVREAKRTRTSKKLERYYGQTRAILEIIPRAVSTPLWDAIRKELPKP